MLDLLIMAAFGLFLYVFVRIMLKEPILPWKEKMDFGPTVNNLKKFNSKKNKPDSTSEPNLFNELFSDVQEISHHMIRFKNNKFVLIAEVDPVNYFLLSQDEQEGIDITFERWLATLTYNVQWYLQNRYIDLSEPIETMRKTMESQDDMPENAIQYGEDLINDLIRWQKLAPRYETKRYIVFPYQVEVKDIKADDKNELEEKNIDKAFAELYRRFNAAKSSLRRANIDVQLLTNEGIVELLYYTFNRKKALKNKFKDIKEKEMLSLYVTADQDDRRIELVKEMINNESDEATEQEQQETAV